MGGNREIGYDVLEVFNASIRVGLLFSFAVELRARWSDRFKK